MTIGERFGRLSTASKLFLILTAAILPIGIALTWVGESGIQQANSALEGQGREQSRAAARAIESLIARNALALRVAANGAFASGPASACDRVRRSLSIAPAIAQNFELEDINGRPVCHSGETDDTASLPPVAPGDIRLRVSPGMDAIAIRVGVIGGMATAVLPAAELRNAIADDDIPSLALHDGRRQLQVLGGTQTDASALLISEWPIGRGTLIARVGVPRQRITTLDRLMLLLPVLMWVAAALITWLLVSRLLIRPLKRLESAVRVYQPGQGLGDLPRRLGPATEIQQLRDAFVRAVSRVDQSEREMTGALEGQRRLVREVHHRVKNNLQVIASLLNIHGRGAETPEARAAYAGISRRVGALSIVHRNHFAEMEENRGIALRPLLSELAAELRAGAPDPARGLMIDLDIDTVFTTQDAAVAVAFLITEIVEFAMLHAPADPIEISLRRTSELTARLTLNSGVLVPEQEDEPEKLQFERIVGGLAKQLRSNLDRKLGRYSVEMPVFPPV
ncbi:sensor histidine kinase [Sphingomonas sp. URHD0057]|uniref:sensor histidine kinase n=1 Tax=Sphingomonas sp. URHD0057 TaxID=1380389 RepID=UPI0006844AF3|nr:sensor histidine kinase [Sphingomonas sp. URHD0057]